VKIGIADDGAPHLVWFSPSRAPNHEDGRNRLPSHEIGQDMAKRLVRGNERRVEVEACNIVDHQAVDRRTPAKPSIERLFEHLKDEPRARVASGNIGILNLSPVPFGPRAMGPG